MAKDNNRSRRSRQPKVSSPKLRGGKAGSTGLQRPEHSMRRNALTSPKSSKPANVPTLPNRIEFNPQEVGFTLSSDEETLKEIEEIREDAIKAAQATRKFAWR
jgi:hypothetical protein